MFTFSISLIVASVISSLAGIFVFGALIIIYKSPKKSHKNLAFVVVVLSVVLLSTINFLYGKSVYIGTTADFNQLKEGIVLSHRDHSQDTGYSIIQELESLDRRLVKKIPVDIPVGSTFILKNGKYFLLKGKLN